MHLPEVERVAVRYVLPADEAAPVRVRNADPVQLAELRDGAGDHRGRGRARRGRPGESRGGLVTVPVVGLCQVVVQHDQGVLAGRAGFRLLALIAEVPAALDG